MKNSQSLDTLCAALAGVMGIEAPAQAAAPCEALTAYAAEKLEGRKADRVFMYNPDAVAQWVYTKYAGLMKEAIDRTELQVPFRTVMPSVTPVCFGTMYTGAQPAVHGIRKYEKPVIKIDTIFDALLRAGKRPVIIAVENCSLSRIYLERDMDYFSYPTTAQVHAKAAELILKDEYDFIVVYNTTYDATMHKNGPEAAITLGELRANALGFATLSEMVKEHWQQHDTLVGFAMDHGCHEIDEGCGSHGLDMEEDLNICHRYMVYPKQ
jgi:predicted AlkP superfamily pyrophosphatase or phosphodiesterase